MVYSSYILLIFDKIYMSLGFYIKVTLSISFITSKFALRHSFIMKNIRVLFRFTVSPKKKALYWRIPN